MKKLCFALVALFCAPAFAGELSFDFETDPADVGVEFFGNAEWRDAGGFEDSGYLSVTDAANGERGTIVFPDVLDGEILESFVIRADLRVGGGTERPADGFSFNFAEPDDEIFDDPESADFFNPSPNGNEASLPEEGLRTGLAVGFDEWDSGAPDVVGLSIHVDGEILDQIEMPVLNGEVDDIDSLQTGPAFTEAEDLGWAPFEIELTAPNNMKISWKDNVVFNDAIDYTPFSGRFVFSGRTGGANATHDIDNLSISFNEGGGGGDPCDLDGSGAIDVGDVDALREAIIAGNGDAKFDINGDSNVNTDDVVALVESGDKLNTYVGDSNLDGEFNSSDFVTVFTAGEYEDATAGNSTWATGDWNADGDFNTSDFVFAFSGGGYEVGPRAATAAVPEPSSAILLLLGSLAFARRRK